MSNTTHTRGELIEAVSERLSISKADASRLVEDLIESVCTTLESGEAVKISGFGTFLLRDKNERMGRNPKSGIDAVITARRVVAFRAGQILKARLNQK